MAAKTDHQTTSHRFLDEAGDTTFYGRNKRAIIGEPGVSRAFYVGSVKFGCPLTEARIVVLDAIRRVVGSPDLSRFPSVQRRIADGGFYFHAKDDPIPVRDLFFDELRDLSYSFEIIVARKSTKLFERSHKREEDEFYADVLGHLLKGKLKLNTRLVLNIAQRGSSTRAVILERALEKARNRAVKKWRADDLVTKVVFNVQNSRNEPLLSVADYLGWSVQRVFERGDTAYYERVQHKISSIHDIYDGANYMENKNWYKPSRPLSVANKIGPPAP